MEWIWVIILLFSVFSNLMEKMAKERERTESSTESRGEELEKPPVRPTEPWPKMRPEPTPYWPETVQEQKLPDHPQAEKGLVTEEEWNQLLGPEQDLNETEAMGMSAKAKDWEFTDRDAGQESEERSVQQLVDAFVLAHALSRPDFRTIPWRRRL
jgi:hypothetical protein